ncbi:hypothetical protein CHS0354_025432 [Potamilus streckersoni]|uniref:Aminotransferase class V domain-containing protein n=1 Tax=Potamilus streckersoni TaxID=2493646 RepID=A0AAE0SQG1_9BIVA|nr:hypothetical protein CHS0354_025432 [Potamilus streckersoni]
MSSKKRIGGGYVFVGSKQADKHARPAKHESTNSSTSSYDRYPVLRYIQDNVIGNKVLMEGPFGPKRVVYCDYTASGRSLSFIEDYIRNYVFPFYANTHSENGRNARQTAKFREEAREIIKQCVNASKDDIVIFTGSGATAALHKVAMGLKVNQSRVAEDTVVFIGPFEHHSNTLPWKEYGVTVVRIQDRHDGYIDVDQLQDELKFWKEKRRLLIVAVSAASNVTGIITDTVTVAKIAHKYGAYVIFDYAAGGPYLKIDMNPSKDGYKDAVLVSPHKFIGGPGTPGLVIAKKWMFRNPVPDRVGGGTVVYVSRDVHIYTSDIENREEGGTPAIIESIRTGMVFQLKQAVGTDVIEEREAELCRRALGIWEDNPNLIILGSHSAKRVTIFSFLVKHQSTGRLLHYNYVSTLLNDLFGIQSRGGCACAGPYTHDLLGISEPTAKKFMWFVSDKSGKNITFPDSPVAMMRPGFTRINLSYFFDDETLDFVIKAVDMVATHGWKLLPQYTFNPYTGIWRNKGWLKEDENSYHSLRDISYDNSGVLVAHRKPPRQASDISFQDTMKKAESILKADGKNIDIRESSASRTLNDAIPRDKRRLRWFMTPQDAIDLLLNEADGLQKKRIYRMPFKVRNNSPILVGSCSEQCIPSSTDQSDVTKGKDNKIRREITH